MSTLSILCVSRNDGYGGNLLERASYSINSFLHVADEVVYVDWNSPGEDLATALADQLHPQLRMKLRVIKIDAAFVDRYVPGPAQTCCEVLGRNIALRRARGDWILSTNIDIVCPRLPLETFDPNRMYTNQRTNFDLDEIRQFSPQDYPSIAAHLERIRPRLQPAGRCRNRHWWRRDVWSIWNCCGDFQLAHRDLWHLIRGFEESLVGRNLSDSNVHKKVMLAGRKVEGRNDLMVGHINHAGRAGGSGAFNEPLSALYKFKRTTNSDDWGYPQLDL